MAPDDRIPVVVSTGQCLERTEPVSALALAERAAGLCLESAPGLRDRIDRVSVVNIMSGAGEAPGAALARRLKLEPARTEVSAIGGNSPQWLVNRAAAAISAGEAQGVLVVGAEAQRSVRLGHGAPVGEPDGAAAVAEVAPDPVVGDDRAGVGGAEMAAGMLAPVHVYAMFESIIARRAGRTVEEHRGALGRLMAPFSAVAATHPAAWFPQARSAAELATVSADNRLVAEPYPKRMCAFLHVDQAAAVLVTSLAAARAAGVGDDAVFCWSGADAAEVWFPSARPDPGSAPGLRAAARAALDAAGTGVDDVGAFDVYSCFPCVVEMAVEALGIAADDARGLTVTGGLPYFGGPGNDYSLHAIATMAERLRRDGGTGLVSAIGWYATKHSVGVYGARPPAAGWRAGDTGDAQRAIDATAVPVAASAEGRAVVVASTVVADRDGSVRAAPVIARLDDGRHIAAAAVDGERPALAGRNLVGERIAVSGAPPRYRLDP